jgi:hypothetical protein
VLRGNHEQMMLDFLDEGAPLWLHPAVGGQHTFGQYTGYKLTEELRAWWEEAQRRLLDAIERAVRLGLRTVEAHARCAFGELLVTRGDPSARTQLEAARMAASRFGMRAIQRRAEEGLARAAA